MTGAEEFCAIRSYLGIATRHGLSALHVLTRAFQGSPVAKLTSDAELLKIAGLTEVPVSLEHLRGLDPQTRIIIRSQLSYEGDEASRVSAATRPRHALATVVPDGTVIPGDVRPLGRLDRIPR